MLTYFFGILAPASGGHHLYLDGQQLTQIAPHTPWGTAREPLREFTMLVKCGPYDRIPEPEGILYTEIADGWTLLACWDRSADRRGGCCATWAVQTIDRDAPLDQIRQFYGPTVARIEAHVGKPLDKWPRRRLLEDYPLASGSALFATTKTCPCCNGTGRVLR